MRYMEISLLTKKFEMACNCNCHRAPVHVGADLPDVPQQQEPAPMAPAAAPRPVAAAPVAAPRPVAARAPVHIKDDPRTAVTFEHLTNITTHIRKTLDETTKAYYDGIMDDNCTDEQQKRVDQLISDLKTLVQARKIIAALRRGE